jgi:hypothetical protein
MDVFGAILRAPRPMLVHQVVLLTSAKSSHPSQLPSRQYLRPITPLDATHRDSLASVASKRLTSNLTPLNATLTKNTGGPRGPSTLPLFCFSTRWTFRRFPPLPTYLCFFNLSPFFSFPCALFPSRNFANLFFPTACALFSPPWGVGGYTPVWILDRPSGDFKSPNLQTFQPSNMQTLAPMLCSVSPFGGRHE